MAINNTAVRPLARNAVRANADAIRAWHHHGDSTAWANANRRAWQAFDALTSAMGLPADSDAETIMATAWAVLDRRI